MTSAGEQLRLDGQDAALAAATVGHHDHAKRIRAAIDNLIRSGEPFGADHVRKSVPEDTQAWLLAGHGNVLSTLMRGLRKRNCHKVGTYISPRKERHGDPNPLWQRKAA